MTYSGSATDERYAMGLLALKAGGDPLNAADWEKSPKPVMVTEEENGLLKSICIPPTASGGFTFK